jgi:hypothetical protein
MNEPNLMVDSTAERGITSRISQPPWSENKNQDTPIQPKTRNREEQASYFFRYRPINKEKAGSRSRALQTRIPNEKLLISVREHHGELIRRTERAPHKDLIQRQRQTGKLQVDPHVNGEPVARRKKQIGGGETKAGRSRPGTKASFPQEEQLVEIKFGSKQNKTCFQGQILCGLGEQHGGENTRTKLSQEQTSTSSEQRGIDLKRGTFDFSPSPLKVTVKRGATRGDFCRCTEPIRSKHRHESRSNRDSRSGDDGRDRDTRPHGELVPRFSKPGRMSFGRHQSRAKGIGKNAARATDCTDEKGAALAISAGAQN